LKKVFVGNRLQKYIKHHKDGEVSNEELREGAVVWLQTLWRSRQARRKYHQQKDEMRQNLLEGYVRKIQRLYRMKKDYRKLQESKKKQQEQKAAQKQSGNSPGNRGLLLQSSKSISRIFFTGNDK
jgi:hypothetical protein